MTQKFYRPVAIAAILMAISVSSFPVSAQELANEAPRNLQPDPVYAQDYVPGAGETAFRFRLSGYVFGLKMISANYKGFVTDSHYQVYTDIKTSGLGAMLKKLRIWAVTQGRVDDQGVHPVTHTQQNIDKKSRRVEMQYDYNARTVSVDINPPIGSQGKPPATPEERFSADDVPSALLAILMQGGRLPGTVCDGTVRVFDSKQHYGLRMELTGVKRMRYNGEKVDTFACDVYYEPISGFDPEDLPDQEEGGTPVKVNLMPDPESGMFVPIRFKYKISGFNAVIELKDMALITG